MNPNIETILTEKGEAVACTAGSSMYPMLRNRKDMIVVETVKRPLKKYDVPLYRLDSGKLVLHRIIKVKPDVYVIRGDNLVTTEYVRPDQIIGVLKAFYRGGVFVDCETNKIYKIYIRIIRCIYWPKLLKRKLLTYISKHKKTP